MIKIRIISNDILLDEAKEDRLWTKKYEGKIHPGVWSKLLWWIHEKRSQRIKYLEWAGDEVARISQDISDKIEKKQEEEGYEWTKGYKMAYFYNKITDNLTDVISSLEKFEDYSQHYKKKDINKYENLDELDAAYKAYLKSRAAKYIKIVEYSVHLSYIL